MKGKGGLNQCKSADRPVDTVPVTGASPTRNSNTVRPDGQWFSLNVLMTTAAKVVSEAVHSSATHKSKVWIQVKK